ncbi:MAG: hypothetical protein WCM93_04625, partial [Bacteroidota bacterium]
MKKFLLSFLALVFSSITWGQNVFFEGFESGNTDGSAIVGWTQESVLGTGLWNANNTAITYNRSPNTGAWNAALFYSNTRWIFKSVSLTGAQQYKLSIYARQDGSTSTNASITLKYGTTGTAAGMVNTILAATGIINGDYQLLQGTFTPATTGTYYIGILGTINGTPYYISIDDISLDAVTSALTSTKTIKASGGNYSTFTAAILDINANGVGAGGVTFNVDADLVTTENCPKISATGTSGNQIIFQKYGSGANPIIKPTGGISTVDAGIRFAGGDYITFDGIDITINSGSAVEYGYYIYNSSATNGAQNNTIKNSKVTLNRTNTSSIGIFQTYITSPTSTAGANSYNKFYNITVENAFNGIYLLGLSAFPDLNTEIGTTGSGQTTIGAATANDIGNGSSTTYGIRVAQQQNIKIFSCEVRNVTGTGTSSAVHGIFLDGIKGTTSAIYQNNVHDIKNSSTSNGSTVTGIRADVASGVVVNIYNNFVSAISHASATASSSQQVRGIACNVAAGTGTVNAYYNSVRIETSQYVSSSAFYTQSGTANTVDNIFLNFSATNATSKRYCFYLSSGTLTTSNYNDLYIATGTNNFVGYNLGDKTTLTNWQTSFTPNKDLNSVNVDPGFSGTTDLHASASGIDGKGTPITTAAGFAVDVPNDIDGATRNATTPDIGADEFVAGVDNPASFSATAYSTAQINLLATANGSGNNIVVVFNGTGTFTAPTNGSAPTAVGTTLAGSGGTIVYYGVAASLTNHAGLTANTAYYYKAFSYDGSNIY